MDIATLLDAQSAAIVLGGTFLATLLRCGFNDCRLALSALGQLGQRRFDADHVRAELALQVRDIQRDGLIRANPRHSGDSEVDEATGALIGSRSVPALLAAHENQKARRLDASSRAIRTWSQAAELAPVFGLAGTLIALSQLPGEGLTTGDFGGAISTAVLTTLYGVLLANLVLAPLARVVERAASAEEKDRQDIVEWLAQQVAATLPSHSGPAQTRASAYRAPSPLAEAI